MSFETSIIGSLRINKRDDCERDVYTILIDALSEIAESGSCGCNPCYGHTERDEYIAIAKAAIAEAKRVAPDVERYRRKVLGI